MRCYYHPDVEAIALCKSCSRALCHNCAVDVPPGTACADRCEEEVQSLNLVLERSKTGYQKASAAYRRSSIGTWMMGTLMILFGVAAHFSDRKVIGVPLMTMGGVFLFWGYLTYKSGKQMASVTMVPSASRTGQNKPE